MGFWCIDQPAIAYSIVIVETLLVARRRVLELGPCRWVHARRVGGVEGGASERSWMIDEAVSALGR